MRLRGIWVALLLATAVLSACQPAMPTPQPAPTRAQVVVTLPPRPTKSPIQAGDFVRGKTDAYVRFTMYGDFACATCAFLAQQLLLIQNVHPNDVAIIWRHYPEVGNNRSFLLAQAAEAAGAQGQFWPMHDALYDQQAALLTLSDADLQARLMVLAQQLNLNIPQFEAALGDAGLRVIIDASAQEGRSRGVRAAPALLVQEMPYGGRVDAYGLEGVVQLTLLTRRYIASAPGMQIDLKKRYQAKLVTEKGDIVLELFADKAPVAVNNFIFLARAGWYDGNTFFKVDSDMALTGDPSNTGLGSAGYFIYNEAVDNGLQFDGPGLVAMHIIRGQINTASSQFFITFGELPEEGYNGVYPIFGRVVAGLEVAQSLHKRNPEDLLNDPNPAPGDKILRVEISEIGP
jgi:cyclophilin family peptidyl-prolyl cis-trans isomerase/protein-disulfide isomerase